MKTALRYFYIFTVAFIFNTKPVWAQSNCAQVLRDARNVYDEGKLHELPEMLNPCLRSGFTSEERIESLRLLTLAYIFLNEPQKAEQSMLNLLRNDPEFQVNESIDPVDFINLYNQFDVNPVFLWGFKAAALYNMVEATEINPFHEQEQYPGTYPLSVGFQAGLTAEIFITEKISVFPEVMFAFRAYQWVHDSLYRGSNQSKTTVYETQWLRAGAVAKYKPEEKIGLYILAGASFDYLLSASRLVEGFVTTPNSSINHLRHPFNTTAILGIGRPFRLGSNYLTLDLRYEYGIRQMLNKDNLSEDIGFAVSNGHGESNFRLHAVSFNVGFLIPRFNPRKK